MTLFGLAGLALMLRVYGQTPDACMVPTTTADSARQVSAATDQVFGIVLAANPGTGYSWSISTDPDPAVAVALDSLALPPDSSLLGAPGRECFRFTATGAGSTSVGFNYAPLRARRTARAKHRGAGDGREGPGSARTGTRSLA
jgi:predicted secreted protein